MQALLQHASFSTATKAATASASRPGTATNSPKERMMIVAVERREQAQKALQMAFDAIEREGALDKLRTKNFAADRLFFQQVRAWACRQWGSRPSRMAGWGGVRQAARRSGSWKPAGQP